MTAIDTTNLEAIANVSFEDFKAAWTTGNTTGNDVASRYYRELKNQGTATGQTGTVNYAELAKDVAANAGVNGVIANEFSQVVAEKNGVDFSVGSDNWLRMQWRLMQADSRKRKENISVGRFGFRGALYRERRAVP